MTTFADTLKKEVSRLARKELKEDVAGLKKQMTQQRLEVSTLKKELKTLQQEIRRLSRLAAKATPVKAKADAPSSAPTAPAARGRGAAFSAEALLACRQRLGLTQKEMAQLLNTSSLSLWKWESGKSVPRSGNLAQIREVLKMGKREAAAKLATD